MSRPKTPTHGWRLRGSKRIDALAPKRNDRIVVSMKWLTDTTGIATTLSGLEIPIDNSNPNDCDLIRNVNPHDLMATGDLLVSAWDGTLTFHCAGIKAEDAHKRFKGVGKLVDNPDGSMRSIVLPEGSLVYWRTIGPALTVTGSGSEKWKVFIRFCELNGLPTEWVPGILGGFVPASDTRRVAKVKKGEEIEVVGDLCHHWGCSKPATQGDMCRRHAANKVKAEERQEQWRKESEERQEARDRAGAMAADLTELWELACDSLGIEPERRGEVTVSSNWRANSDAEVLAHMLRYIIERA